MRAMFKKLDENAKLPTKAHDDDVGYDLYAVEDAVLEPQRVTKVRTGIAYCGLDELHNKQLLTAVFPKIEGRSGLASRGIFPVGGIVDPGYRGEVSVMLANFQWPWSSEDDGTGYRAKNVYQIKAGDRIAQIVFYTTAQPEVDVGELKGSSRGDAGFGSTGK